MNKLKKPLLAITAGLLSVTVLSGCNLTGDDADDRDPTPSVTTPAEELPKDYDDDRDFRKDMEDGDDRDDYDDDRDDYDDDLDDDNDDLDDDLDDDDDDRHDD